MVFCGLSDSYERFYQAVRRCWRFGQKKPVDVYIILSEREMNVLYNIQRKQRQMEEMQSNMIALMKDVTMSEMKHTTRITTEYKPEEEMEIPTWIA
jgi:SNF2 family DNA or RNA helicase